MTQQDMSGPIPLQITSGSCCLPQRGASPLDQEKCTSTGCKGVSTLEPSSHPAVGRRELGMVGMNPQRMLEIAAEGLDLGEPT